MEENELLDCVIYNYEHISNLKTYKKFYVYLIINSNNEFYVGKSENLFHRITFHNKEIKHLYILESCDDIWTMDCMELIWISWYKINKKCINISHIEGYKIRKGIITYHTIKNTNYEKMINYGVINSFKLLNKYVVNGVKTYKEYFEEYLKINSIE